MVGEVVYVKDKNGIDLVLNADGSISASISGGTVRILSGDTVQVVIRNTAGTSAQVAVMSVDGGPSAQSTAIGSAPNGVVSIAAMYGAHPTNAAFVRIGATSPISGAGYRMLASISGETVNIAGGSLTTAVSGQTIYLVNDGINNVGKISGQTVYLVNDGINNVSKISGQTVIAATSGQTIRFTNDGVNNVATVSGNVVYTYGTTPKTNALVSCTNLSGGTTLPNISCIKCMVRSVSGNNVMYLGGTGAQSPFSGTGIELYGGEATPWIDVNNVNTLSVFATTSGQSVSIFAIA